MSEVWLVEIDHEGFVVDTLEKYKDLIAFMIQTSVEVQQDYPDKKVLVTYPLISV